MFLVVRGAVELFFEAAGAVQSVFLLREPVLTLGKRRCPILLIVGHMDDGMISRCNARRSRIE